MNINPNHKADGEAAWAKCPFKYNQTVRYEGHYVRVVGVGYGKFNNMENKVEVEYDDGTKILILISDCVAIE